MEVVVVTACARLGIPSGQFPGLTGVWFPLGLHWSCPLCRREDGLKPAKSAAIGVKKDARGILRHGFALNVDPDMSYWDGIVACGPGGLPPVGMADLDQDFPTMQTVKT